MDIFEPNDSIEAAVGLLEGFYSITGQNHDWYAIDVDPGLIDLTMTPYDGVDVNMVLYNSDMQVIGADFHVGTEEHVTAYSTVSDTFYIEIYPTATSSATYDLSIDLPDNTWAAALDFGPIRNVPVALYDIDNDGTDEIFVGTSKTLDAAGNEVRPAGFICLESDGSVKWSVSFPAMTTPDPTTGLTYNTTSVSSAPLFTDVDGDGAIDIVVGVGGDPRGEFANVVGQPGDKGGVYALSATGEILWFHESLDIIGGPTNAGDGRPDGVYSAPVAFDIDRDGVPEIIYGGWDQHLWVLDGRTGETEFSVFMYDTIWSSPRIADINADGVYEIIIGADITANAAVGTETGGVLHVVSAYGTQTLSGWDQQIGSTTDPALRGQYEEQVLWSSPVTADLDGDGTLEIIHGTGNYFHDERGSFVEVWNADGTLRHHLTTEGRTFANVLVNDLDGDGRPEIVAATLDGYLYGWNSSGEQLFATLVRSYGVPDGSGTPLFSTPLAVDLNGDGRKEILVTTGAQVQIFDSSGVQLNDPTVLQYIVQSTSGTPAVGDVDGDGYLDIIAGATNAAQDQAVVYRFNNLYSTPSDGGSFNQYQSHQSLSNIDAFVDRFYQEILNRTPDAEGNAHWNDWLYNGTRTGADVARGFIFSQEFINRGLSNDDFVNVLYHAFFGREPDTGGYDYWVGQLNGGAERASVLDGFILSTEFANLAANYSIRPVASDLPNSGPGNDNLFGGAAFDILNGGQGDDVIYGDGTPSAPSPTGGPQYAQMYRLYGAAFAREPDSVGLDGWVSAMFNGLPLSDIAGAFVSSSEFSIKYGSLDNTEFVTLLYRNVLDREPDAGGLAYWVGQLDGGVARQEVLLGFSESGEYQNSTDPTFHAFMGTSLLSYNDVVEGGAGNDTLAGGRGSDTFIFRQGAGGTDTVIDFESWDRLQLSGFGYDSAADALAHMTQQSADVVFDDQEQVITFTNTTLDQIAKAKWNVS